MAAEVIRRIGGAGTGKTRYLLEALSEARREFGLSHREVGLCTFTRAGRQELSERAAGEWGVDVDSLTRSGWFRTAHSIAHRQCGVEKGALLQGQDGADWVGESVGGKMKANYKSDTAETFFESIDGDPVVDVSMKAWDLARSRLCPLSVVLREWSATGSVVSIENATAIIGKYERAKSREGRLDFTDMISQFAGIKHSVDGPTECDPKGDVPEEIKVLAIDEAQDSSAIVDRICRRLADSDSMKRVLLVGDPYQSIYRFGGSDFRHFLAWDADETTMPRSYRCPPNIMALGEKCIRGMRSGYRDRGILPASHGGTIAQLMDAREAVSRIDTSESVLILGRCGFSLDEYELALQDSKIPYCWVDKVHATQHLYGFRCLWDLERGKVVTGDEWAHAIQMTSVKSKRHGKLLAHGEKTAWADGKRGHVNYIRPLVEDLVLAGCTEEFAALVLSGQWVQCLESRHSDTAAAWRSCAVLHGPELASNPKVRLSTIHAAKGLEGDTVILSTISSAAVTAATEVLQEAYDEECRVNYVAVTRARRNLWIVDDGGKHSLELPL